MTLPSAVLRVGPQANAYGKYVPRRRVIEGGLISLGVGLLLLSIAGRISAFLSNAEAQSDLLDLSSVT